MKTVSLDLQDAVKQQKSGIGWYAYNIVEQLLKNNKNKYIGELLNYRRRIKYSVFTDSNMEIKELTYFKKYAYLEKQWINKYINYNRLIGTRSDIYHFFCFLFPLNITGKVITTMHDTIFVDMPECYPNPLPAKPYINAGKRADVVATVSEQSRKDIIRNFHVDTDKIVIIPPGIHPHIYDVQYSEWEASMLKLKYNLPERFMLSICTLEPRKNLSRTLEAFHQYRMASGDDIKFVMVGGKGWKYEGIFETIERLNLQKDVLVVGYVAEQDKPILYKMAEMFVFASLYEGFGMPVLESMAAGTPVITSNISSMPEVAGEGAVLVDPYSVQSITHAMDRVLNSDATFRDKLQSAARVQVERFTWENTCDKIEELYERM